MQGIISSVGSVYTVTNWSTDEREITLSSSNWVVDSVGGGYQYQLRGSDIGSGYVVDPNAEFEILPTANTLAYLSDYNRINSVFSGAESGDGADPTKSAYYFYSRINKPEATITLKLRTRTATQVIV